MTEPHPLSLLSQRAADLLSEWALGPSSADHMTALAQARRLLQPRHEDWARVFRSGAERRRQAYQQAWEAGAIVPEGRRSQTRVEVHAAPSDLIADPAVGAHFPGGYQDIVEELVPGRAWCCFSFKEPGARHGMSWDGLVWLPDADPTAERAGDPLLWLQQMAAQPGHWAWFPKPWRI